MKAYEEQKKQKTDLMHDISEAIKQLNQLKIQRNVEKREMINTEKKERSNISKNTKKKKKKKSQLKDEASMKRSKTLDAQGEFTRARLLNGIVDKIKEVRDGSVVGTQKQINVVKQVTEVKQTHQNDRSRQSRDSHHLKQAEYQLIKQLTTEVELLKKQIEKRDRKKSTGLSSVDGIKTPSQKTLKYYEDQIVPSTPYSSRELDITFQQPTETREELGRLFMTKGVQKDFQCLQNKPVVKKEQISEGFLPFQYQRAEKPERWRKLKTEQDYRKMPNFIPPPAYRSPSIKQPNQVKFTYGQTQKRIPSRPIVYQQPGQRDISPRKAQIRYQYFTNTEPPHQIYQLRRQNGQYRNIYPK